MYGVVTRNAEELAWDVFDRGFFEVKDVTGRRTDPVQSGTNMISCFGDSDRGQEEPSLVPISREGERATRDSRYFDWGFICPSRRAYRQELLDLIKHAGSVQPDVRIDDIGFPRAEYCYCETCEDSFDSSEFDSRDRWRSSIITEFVADVRERVPGRLSATIYPDPYPGHLEERAGVDVDDLASYVDEFIIPIYDMSYSTTYWVEVLASGFLDRLPRPFSVELYAVNLEVDALARAATVADAYAKDVFFAYDAATGREAIERLRDGADA